MSLDQAKEYLARVIPWPENGESWINLHWTFVPKDHDPTRKLPWTGRAVRTVQEAASAVEWALKTGKDIYACLSSQRDAQETISQRNRKYYKPVRLAENAVALKALWADIDVKQDSPKGYNSMDELIAALGTFLKATGLPKPSMIVGSGGGVHLYWVVSRALTVAEWYPLAAALEGAMVRHDLKHDPVTTDAARVLRVPDTWNYKTDPPRPVRILSRTDGDYTVERLDKVLAPYKSGAALPEHLVGFAPHIERRTPLPGVSDLSGGIETAMPRDQIRACLDAIPNPGTDWNLWNSVGMRVFSACEGADYGREEWQRWSDKVQTEGKDSVDARWETFQTSPPTRTGAGALVNAARGALKLPGWFPGHSVAGSGMLLAPTVPVLAPAITPQVNDLPNGYARDAKGVVSYVEADEDGKQSRIPISSYPMTDAWLQKDPWILHFTTTTERGRSQQISLPLDSVGGMDMRKVLQSQGFMVNPNPKLSTEFFVAWIQKLQESRDIVSSAPFGWNMKGNQIEGFVYGGKMFTPAGEKSSANPDPVLARQYEPTGDLAPWIDAVKMITKQKRPQLEAIVASAFAAPLVRFTGQSGLLMSAWSLDSGIGKSTAMQIAQAVWGHPVKATQMLTDTQNSVINKIGEIRSLPMYWDELKTEYDTKKFVEIAFRLSLGKEKSRMTQSVKQREVGTWQTILVSASNDSLLSYIVDQTSTTTAGLYRVFEYEVTRGVTGQIDSSVAARLIARLQDNFGMVGLEYAHFLGNNVPRIDADIAQELTTIGEQVKSVQDERFWVALMAAMCVGARYANELQLADFDEKALREFLYENLERLRGERRESSVDMRNSMNVSDKLGSFLSAMQGRHTLYTNRINMDRGKPKDIKIVREASLARLDGVWVHIGVHDKVLRISSAALNDWCKDVGISRQNFVDALFREFGARKVNGRLGAGTNYSTTTQWIYEICLADTPLLDFLDEPDVDVTSEVTSDTPPETKQAA